MQFVLSELSGDSPSSFGRGCDLDTGRRWLPGHEGTDTQSALCYRPRRPIHTHSWIPGLGCGVSVKPWEESFAQQSS